MPTTSVREYPRRGLVVGQRCQPVESDVECGAAFAHLCVQNDTDPLATDVPVVRRIHDEFAHREASNPCLLVKAVDGHGAAAKAGVRPGDRLVRAGGRAVHSISCLYRALDAATGRGRLRVRLQRRGRDMNVTIDFPQVCVAGGP